MATRRLLAVMAHPDDETFGMGGTLAIYAKRGADVQLICATGGEAGTVAPEFLAGYESIAELREAELRCAAENLRLSQIHFLGYRDSGMPGTPDNDHAQALAQAPKQKVATEIKEIIRAVRPQVVVTHNPAGEYGHPDHVAVHEATVEAFHSVVASGGNGDPQKLYYSTFSLRYLKILISVSRLIGRDPTRWGRNQDIDLTELTKDRFPTNARINFRPAVAMKRRAIACHASQLEMGPAMRGLTGLVFRLGRLRSYEQFMRGHPRMADARVERDLFAGVDLGTRA